MKKIAIYFILGISMGLISCSSDATDDPTENENLMTLKKAVLVSSNTAGYYSKTVFYYSNNQVYADTTFNAQNQWYERRVISTQGNIKTYTNYYAIDGSSAISQIEGYDAQGRVISRHTSPNSNVISFTYVYNSDNTITSVIHNAIDGQTTNYKKYYKNNNGLIYKELNINTGIERVITFEGDKPISITNGTASITFNYFPNPKPANLLKTPTELNNIVLIANDLQKLGLEGNFYAKEVNVFQNETIFNTLNYKTLQRFTRQNSSNITSTDETTYFYN
ncbi:MAG TPA: hypothetical protein VFR70_02575 [Flavobacterium sp.]|nr:hypothetical protein [Flavobacterium sp.]